MKEREALKLALEVLRMPCSYWNKTQFIKVQEAIKACEEALANHIPDAENMVAQPEQEPVAWRWLSSKTWKQWSLSDDKKLVAEAVEWLGEEKVQPLYTTPPQRTWVGLDWNEMPEIYMNDKTFEHGAQWAEAKLKEKNT